MMQDVTFTAHNIRLDDGTSTKPSINFTMDRHPICVSAKKILTLLYPYVRSGVRIADLGCLEGGYSVEFARMGFNVVGIEVRESNIAACEFVKRRVDLPNLSFVKDDVWNIRQYGPFDVVFCCGLFYHLDRPVEFLKLVSSITSRAIILQTHFSTDLPNPKLRLGDLCSDEDGYQGRWQIEFSNDEQFNKREDARWASWDNRRSFFVKREYLLQAVVDAGFDVCLEQFDQLGNIATSINAGFYKTDERGTFVGIKSNPQGAQSEKLRK